MSALPVEHVSRLEVTLPSAQWLVERVWGRQAVGIIGGAPKCCKSWLALDLATSVATDTPALGRFDVHEPGLALVYLAEDALPIVRQRIAGIAAHRGLSLEQINLHVITAPSVRLDLAEDQERLGELVATLKPRLLVLDPLVRLHRLDENSAGEISGLLAYLRTMQREHALAIVVVHHMTKRRHAHLGQALRGSGDLHAWGDSNAYLVRRHDRLAMTLEHRSAAAPEPLTLALVTDPRHPERTHLEVIDDTGANSPSADAAAPPLIQRVRRALADASGAMSRVALGDLLRVNNQRLGEALTELERADLITRTSEGWSTARQAAAVATVDASDPQLCLT